MRRTWRPAGLPVLGARRGTLVLGGKRRRGPLTAPLEPHGEGFAELLEDAVGYEARTRRPKRGIARRQARTTGRESPVGGHVVLGEAGHAADGREKLLRFHVRVELGPRAADLPADVLATPAVELGRAGGLEVTLRPGDGPVADELSRASQEELVIGSRQWGVDCRKGGRGPRLRPVPSSFGRRVGVGGGSVDCVAWVCAHGWTVVGSGGGVAVRRDVASAQVLRTNNATFL